MYIHTFISWRHELSPYRPLVCVKGNVSANKGTKVGHKYWDVKDLWSSWLINYPHDRKIHRFQFLIFENIKYNFTKQYIILTNLKNNKINSYLHCILYLRRLSDCNHAILSKSQKDITTVKSIPIFFFLNI